MGVRMCQYLTIQWFYSIPTCAHFEWRLFLESQAWWCWYWGQWNSREQCTTADQSELERCKISPHCPLQIFLHWTTLFPLFLLQNLIYGVIFVLQSWSQSGILSKEKDSCKQVTFLGLFITMKEYFNLCKWKSIPCSIDVFIIYASVQ